MRQKIILTALFFGSLIIGAGLGSVGYYWYRHRVTLAQNSQNHDPTPSALDPSFAFEDFKTKANKENERLSATNGLVIRETKNILSLKLTDGRWIYLNDDLKCEHDTSHQNTCTYFLYLSHLKSVNAFIFYATLWDGEEEYYLWKDDRTGEETVLDHYPHLSPSGQRILLINSADAFAFDGIKILNLISGKPHLEWQYPENQSPRYYYTDAAWDGEDAINISADSYNQNSEWNKVSLRLVRLPKWHLEVLSSSPKTSE